MHRVWKWCSRHFVPTSHNAYRPRVLHSSWLALFFGAILAVEGFLVAGLVTRQSSNSFLAAVVPGEIIALTNDERAHINVGALHENAALDQAAQAKATDMAAKGYFSHVGPDSKEPWDWVTVAGYSYQTAGESLAVRFVDSSDVVDAWVASPSHKATMVEPTYTDVGVGVANGIYQGRFATFVVEYVASPELAAGTQPLPGAIINTALTPAAVAGAAQSHAASVWESLVRQSLRLFSEPRSSAAWILGSIAAALLLALLLTTLVRVHIQPAGMLLSGGLVLASAVSLLLINTTFLHTSTTAGSSVQAAAVAESATFNVTPVIDSSAVRFAR